MIDSTFVEAMAEEIRAPQVVKVNGREHLAMPQKDGDWRRENLELPEVLPDPIKLGTLTGFVDFVRGNRDGLVLEKHLVHVVSPTRVDLLGPLCGGPFSQRARTAVADLAHLVGEDGFRFGQFMDMESFVIALQARFVPTPARDAVLKLVGNVKDEAVRQTSDDGVTQSVVAKQGAALVVEVPVPNPVELAPYRTFREVEQPEARFILRLRSGGPLCALFEADGASWKLEAIERIATYLGDALSGTKIAVLA